MSKRHGGFKSTFLEARKEARKRLKTAQVEGVDWLTNELKQYGSRIVNELAMNKQTRNITGNQADSYVWVLSLNGNKIAHGYVTEKRFVRTRVRVGSGKNAHYAFDQLETENRLKANRNGRIGRTDASYIARSYTPSTSKGYELLIANGAWYSYYHEHPKAGNRYWMIVNRLLSPSWTELENKYGKVLVTKMVTLKYAPRAEEE